MHADRVRAQLDRLLASATFADTERASSFLRFIVDRAAETTDAAVRKWLAIRTMVSSSSVTTGSTAAADGED